MPNKKLFSKIYDAIIAERSPIEINAKKRSDKPNVAELLNLPVYDVAQIQLDDESEPFYLSGSSTSIMMQLSLVVAIHDLLGSKLGFTIDFEEWFDDFEWQWLRINLPDRKKPPI